MLKIHFVNIAKSAIYNNFIQLDFLLLNFVLLALYFEDELSLSNHFNQYLRLLIIQRPLSILLFHEKSIKPPITFLTNHTLADVGYIETDRQTNMANTVSFLESKPTVRQLLRVFLSRFLLSFSSPEKTNKHENFSILAEELTVE